MELLLGEEALRIDPRGREVVTAAGKSFAYDRLLIATGGTPERPKIEGGDLPFVFTVRDLPDVTGIRERLSGRAGRAVIAGAGPVGMEIGDALHGLGMAITFVVDLQSGLLDDARRSRGGAGPAQASRSRGSRSGPVKTSSGSGRTARSS